MDRWPSQNDPPDRTTRPPRPRTPAIPIDVTPDAPDPTANEAQTYSRIRTSLIKALRTSPNSVAPICDALELLETLQQRAESTPSLVAAAPERRASPQQEYLIQQTPDGPYLTERRPTGSQPFRCPRQTYDTIARLLAAHGPLHFDELLNRLNEASPERQADYRLRVCLRFWITTGLAQRIKTRYRPTNPDTFESATRDAWDHLAADPPL
ncbi:MAG TPA: hypothetical protein VEA69_04415 [Tepidisphaeraceae bacterium]|nr:hypothetical protein [Tepidisphaeraceae bacterium]